MRFIQSSPTQLIAHNSVMRTRLFYGLLLIFGLAIPYLPTPSVEGHFYNQLLSYGVAMYSLVAVVIYGRFITWTFNKDDNSLTARSRFLFVSKTSTYPLTDIAGVKLESQVTNEIGSRAFGINLHVYGGEKLRLCPKLNLSEYTAKEAVVRISNFLS